MRYMLDTNICIYLINDRPATVRKRLEALNPGDAGVSSITVAELAYGVAKTRSSRNRSALESFLLPLDIADFGLDAAMVYGDVRAAVEQKGTPIGPLDMEIAAHAVALDVILVTNNQREFSRVAGLRCENWV
ncbi:MAG: type II toxin-antitoxin system VapC family toxin [Burkholderiales bacterium]|nr:type II toxin-antitoxin system VapC family toxin [Burkholderiales bacterium]